MHVLRRPGLNETLISLACVVVVFAALLSLDAHVRERVGMLFAAATSANAQTLTARLAGVGDAIVGAARERQIDEAPLLVFAVAGGMLFLFMLRT